MVLFKRKPVLLIPPPEKLSDNADVFEMRGTGELFTDYEKYLRRLDYLSQKKFTDAVNGKSGLTFFAALLSETKSSTAIENMFPEVLKDPILRRVQFSTISRVDDLVNSVFDEFKRDFFPGEDVIITFADGEQNEGVIREKAKFPIIRGPDGSVQRAAFSRYFVRLKTGQDEEALVDDMHIRRDKKVFTKQNLRSFLKNSLQREGWIGAPWLVKEHLAIHYRITMEIPSHLLQDAKLLANKQQMLQTKQPRGKARSRASGDVQPQTQQMAQMPLQHQGSGIPPTNLLRGYQQPIATRVEAQAPAPPPVKYPIEDIDLEPNQNGVSRPELKFFTDEMASYIKSDRQTTFQDLDMESLGLLLEVWNTLNVQCEVYVLDSFTFDDFVDAMRYSLPHPTCELLEEVHCAVLKQLVDDQGKLMVKGGMPEIVTEDESDEESEEAQEESEDSTYLPDVPARSTRSRLSHVDPAIENPRSPVGPPEKLHRAAEMQNVRDWKERLAARDLEDGGWQVILAGVLYQLSFNPGLKARCDEILAVLAPLDEEPSRETARLQYVTMHINLRISALQIVTMLSIGTEAIREFLEQCSDDMTDVRKRKIEHQRQKRTCYEELQAKDRERKILLPANMPESPKPESADPFSAASEGDDTLETNGAASASDPDEDAPPGRALRRGNDRKRKRDEEYARREKEKLEKAEAAKTQSKQSKEFKKVLHEIDELKKKIIDHEAKIVECDSDLREANVQRTRMLGQDRFCNRYYWYERNGQPFGGLPRSSTASYGYANGRIWVQGPDKHEIGPFLNDAELQKEYKAKFNMTVAERRVKEEGATLLRNPREWGYYDDPDRLDNLIGWLDDRGIREKKLRKELWEWRDTIVQYMKAFKDFRDQEAAKKIEAEEEQSTRVTTRHKTAEDQTAARVRCLKWTNTMALDEFGHLHSAPARPKERKQPKQPKGVATLVNRQGKPLTRQGGNHRFK